MAIAFVQDQSNNNGGSSSTTVSASFNSATTAGNFIAVGVLFHDTTQSDLNAVTVKDNNNNSFTLAGSWSIGTAIGFSSAIYFMPNAPSMTSVTATIGSSLTFSRIWIVEFSGVATSNPLDQTATGNGSSGSLSTNNITTTQANELLFGVGVNANGTVGTGSGWTTPPNGTAGLEKDEYQIVSSNGTFNFPFTDSGGGGGAWVDVGATFIAAGSTAFDIPQLGLTGAGF